MKLGTETGSLINHVCSTSRQVEPKVGMGATILQWTDRQAVTIIEVTPKTITVQYDKATRTDSNGQSECQSYDYATDPDGSVSVFRMTKKGWRNDSGNGLSIGHRDKYRDPSF